jgi:hypothetical protein
MAPLTQLPELVGFFSYSREDDEDFRGSLSALRDAISRDLRAHLGRNKRNFSLWQDQDAIAPGKDWKAEITKAVEQSVFFIPIVTPRAVGSEYCQFEFSSFAARESALGRSDLVFPILWISVSALMDEAEWRDDPVLSIVAKRQYVDWRSYRYVSADAPALGQAIDRFCGKIAETLRERWISPEERRQLEAAAKKRAAEEERVRQEAEAKRQAEERERLREEALAERRTESETRLREQAERQRETPAPLPGANVRFTPRIFFSYANEDKYWVEAFQKSTGFANVGVVRVLDYAAEEVGYGDLGERLNEQIHGSAVVIAFVSSNYCKKRWTVAEWGGR